ncbi:MAG: hypothetical protein A2508_10400 [Candidatus Lambdaproteobacteria bacterium RIFOXYD12_FULL_49_8]|uniref:VWFA domain-containing protein n=1 Tax=Candidatus Lambdaproteobacteria bacterium RIFOXYD2_FULL_50_16 TaxID=1817772 RepID=A0A1F6GB62_9PROT|nr:MAG: hypothetical protein A2527_07440 [Candidatus Lambdaproteobacteria bacterium RIFOXYD2_FULL_50_16]OGG97076.1 MAG: hypothetical protein A2508_10400 [Candidatus Lambdaproteobacteria bacterium RIFOXYD12_FULL_49_8]
MRSKGTLPDQSRPEAELFRRVKALQLQTRRQVDEHLAGEYQSAFKGRGMEFDQVREYVPGDDPRHIDWMVTARLGHPYIKTYHEERELSVFFVIDGSASSGFGLEGASRYQKSVEVAATIGLSGLRKNDALGLLVFTDQIELFIPPKKGRKHLMRLLREMLYFQPEHKGTDLKGALEYCNHALKRRGVIFVLSDFISPEGYEKPLRHLAKKQDLVAIETGAAQLNELKGMGLLEVEDLETGQRVLIDTDLLPQTPSEDRSRFFTGLGADYLKLAEGEDLQKTLTRFFLKRGRRR